MTLGREKVLLGEDPQAQPARYTRRAFLFASVLTAHSAGDYSNSVVQVAPQ